MKFKKLIAFCFFAFMSSANAEMQNITVCDDDQLWPPYVFLAPGDKKKIYTADATPIGYAVDALKIILDKNNISHTQNTFSDTLILLPWEKCLNDVRDNKINMILEITKTPELEVSYVFSKSFYQTHHAVFFSKKYYPNGFNFENLSDFRVSPKTGRHYKACELRNYVDYEPFGISDSDTIPVDDIQTAVQKLQNRDCDYFFGIVEVVDGYYKITNKSKDIGFEKLTIVPPTEYFFAVSKKFPERAKLIRILNAGIDDLKKTNMTKTLEDKWFK